MSDIVVTKKADTASASVGKYVPVQIKRFAKPKSRETPENRWWQDFEVRLFA